MTKLLGCVAATAIGAVIVTAMPTVAFAGGMGSGGMRGGSSMPMGVGSHAPMSAGRSVAVAHPGMVGNGWWWHHHHHFRNFVFVGVPFYSGYAASYGNYCWQQIWTPYGWHWNYVCDGDGY